MQLHYPDMTAARRIVALNAADANRLMLPAREEETDEAEALEIVDTLFDAANAIRANGTRDAIAEEDPANMLDRAAGMLFVAAVALDSVRRDPIGSEPRATAWEGITWIVNEVRHNPEFGGPVDLGHFDDPVGAKPRRGTINADN